MIKCDECGILFQLMTDGYICPTCGAENEPIDLEQCDHPRLNMDGICFKCGEDCRGCDMSESRQYMLMEIMSHDTPRFQDGVDSWLCPYEDWPAFLGVLFDEVQIDQETRIKFTIIEMTDDEHAAYCEGHGIEWE